jgi:hypothetical protein
MKEIVKSLIIALVLVVIGCAFVALLVKATEKEEKIECYKLQEQSQEYRRGFFITEWQKEMCDRWNIKVDAPVESDLI